MPLPINPSTVDALLGKDFLFYVNIGTAEIPEWAPVGGQRSGSVKRTAEEIDASNKTTDGWASKKAGLRSWTFEAEAIAVLTDEGADALAEAFENGQEVNVQFKNKNGKTYTGWGSITDFSLETPHDDVASLSITISGNGKLEAA